MNLRAYNLRFDLDLRADDLGLDLDLRADDFGLESVLMADYLHGLMSITFHESMTVAARLKHAIINYLNIYAVTLCLIH